MTTTSLEIWSSILNFLGGAILSWDAFRVRRRVREESGARRFQEIMRQVGGGEVLKTKEGDPVNTEKALKLWLSERSLKYAVIGFALMTAGFLLHLLAVVTPG